MPHQCVRCSALYPDGANQILTGCTCGAKLFFYVKKQQIEEGKELIGSLTEEDKQHIAEDVAEILNIKQEDPDKPVVLDIEAIRVLKPGKYELDLVHLFKNDPLIIKLDEGKYFIDLAQAFKKEEKNGTGK